MLKKTFYITTPIYYPSGKPHIGHAYSTILADVIARYKKLIGYDTFMLTGTDEHGQKIQDKAKELKITPQQLVDQNTKIFKDLWEKLDINYSKFIRTTDKTHIDVVQRVFNKYQEDNLIYLGEWSGLYCVSCEENYTKGQATKKDDGLYCYQGHKLTEKKEPSYFFKMSKFNEWIINFYNDNKDLIIPTNRIKELTNSFLNEGLQDLSVSRTSIDWGIPIINDTKHKVYVWIDALLNYLSALNYLQKDDTLFQKYWVNGNEIVHVMSKEITRFHCIYWPIMLHCLKLRQPTNIISHGWIITEEGKMSKSLGNVIDPNEYIDKYGSDALRYFLLKEISLQNDGIFSDKLFKETYNADLANIYGNLVSRTIGMLKKYNNGTIKKASTPLNKLSNDLKNKCLDIVNSITTIVNSFDIKLLINKTLELAKSANKFIEDTKPWELLKVNKNDEINNFLFILTNVVRTVVVTLQPILTNGTKQMVEQLKLNKGLLDVKNLQDFDLLNDHIVSESTPIYKRV